MGKHLKILSLCLLAALGVFLRLKNLTHYSLTNDELYNMSHFLNLERGFGEFMKPFLSWEVHPPLSQFVLYQWTRLFGDGELAIRLPGALMGCATLGFVYGIARILFGTNTALIALGFYSVQFASISLSQLASYHGWLSFFATGSIYFALQAFASEQARGKVWFTTYALILVVMGYVDYLGTVFALLQLLIFSLAPQFRPFRKRIFLVAAFCTLCFLPWWPIVFRQYFNLATHDYSRDLGTHPISGLFSYYLQKNSWLQATSAALIFWYILAKSARAIRSRDLNKFDLSAASLALLFGIPIGFVYIFSIFAQPIWRNHYFGFLAPIFAIFCAYIAIERLGKKRAFLYMLAYVLFSLMLFFGGHYDRSFPIRVDAREAVKYIVNSNIDCPVINHSWNKFNFEYYFIKNGFDDVIYLIENGSLDRLNEASGIDSLNGKLTTIGANCVWFINTYSKVSPLLLNYLELGFTAVQSERFVNAYVVLYRRKRSPN